MKKFFLWLLIAAFLVALVGCNNKQKQLDETNNAYNTEATQNTATEIYTNFLNNYANNTELFYFTKDSRITRPLPASSPPPAAS